MTYATGFRHGLSYVPEASFGVTPSSPDMTSLRHTACSLGHSTAALASEDITGNRQLSHLLLGQQTVSGDIDFELTYGAYDALLAAAFQSDWDGDTLKIGTSQPSFTFERAFEDIGQYQHLHGCIIDQFSLSLRPDRLAAGKFSVMGKGSGLATEALDASPVAASSLDPLDSYSGSVVEGGSSLALVAAAELRIDNNHEQAFTLGSSESSALVPGSARISGELVCYFEDATLLGKFAGGTESSLTLTVNGSGGSYAFSLPRILYTGADNPVAGEGPITLSLPFTALYDSTVGTSLSLTRIAP
jgi:hypothetical protein